MFTRLKRTHNAHLFDLLFICAYTVSCQHLLFDVNNIKYKNIKF